MLRKIFVCICCAGVLMLAACNKKDTGDIKTLSQDEIYFFYQENCPHCHDAAAYIKEKHSNAKIKSLDIKMPGNKRMFQAAVRSYKVGFGAGTPLICFGDHYIMGWGPNDKQLFDYYARPYLDLVMQNK